MELDWQEMWVRLKRGAEQFEDEDLKWSEELKVLEWEPKPEEPKPEPKSKRTAGSCLQGRPG